MAIEHYVEKGKGSRGHTLHTVKSRIYEADGINYCLLYQSLLRNDEICFLVKDGKGASQMCNVEDIDIRADKSVYAALIEDNASMFMPVFNWDGK